MPFFSTYLDAFTLQNLSTPHSTFLELVQTSLAGYWNSRNFGALRHAFDFDSDVRQIVTNKVADSIVDMWCPLVLSCIVNDNSLGNFIYFGQDLHIALIAG